MSDTALPVIFHYGTSAARASFTPSPAAGVGQIYIWYETDTDEFYIYTTTWKGPYASSAAAAAQKYALSPDGSTTVFTLAVTPASDDFFLLFWNGVLQGVTDDYTLVTDTLTTVFTAGASDKLTYVVLRT